MQEFSHEGCLTILHSHSPLQMAKMRSMPACGYFLLSVVILLTLHTSRRPSGQIRDVWVKVGVFYFKRVTFSCLLRSFAIFGLLFDSNTV